MHKKRSSRQSHSSLEYFPTLCVQGGRQLFARSSYKESSRGVARKAVTVSRHKLLAGDNLLPRILYNIPQAANEEENHVFILPREVYQIRINEHEMFVYRSLQEVNSPPVTAIARWDPPEHCATSLSTDSRLRPVVPPPQYEPCCTCILAIGWRSAEKPSSRPSDSGSIAPLIFCRVLLAHSANECFFFFQIFAAGDIRY